LGVLTDFFVASTEELQQAFPAWLVVAPVPVTREVTNPFTGQKQTATRWVPLQRPSEKCSPQDRLQNYRDLDCAEFKSIGVVELAKLHAFNSNTSYEKSIEQFSRPALIDPWESDETGLHRLSTDFVSSLASISDDRLAEKAAEWAEIEELARDKITAADCEMVLHELVRLARVAQQTHRDMYYCWSL
jgi:hypothetical protein